jgi:hypothetical protein
MPNRATAPAREESRGRNNGPSSRTAGDATPDGGGIKSSQPRVGSIRYRDPVRGGTGRLDYSPSGRALLVHEQNGGYTRDHLSDLAEATGADGVGDFLDQPARYLAPYAISGGPRRGRKEPLPSPAEIDGMARRLFATEATNALAYLTDVRGLSLDVLRAARVGWNGRHLIFPMYVGGALVAAKRRLPIDGAAMECWAGQGRPWPLYPEPRATWRRLLLLAGDLDALRGVSEGLPAASVTLGAGTWRDDWTEQLRPVRVVVCFDNNEVEQARAVVERLKRAGISARRLDLRRLGLDTPKGDLSDYLNGGGTAREIRAALRSRRVVRRSR